MRGTEAVMRSHCVEMRRARPLLGTFVEITARAPNECTLRRAIDAGFAAIAQVHRLMSRHDPASDVGRLNRSAVGSRVEVHRWTRRVLRAARQFSTESGGAFDVTLGAGGSWRDVVVNGDGSVYVRRPVRLDLGGVAKGFAVDRAVDALKKAGGCAGLVNAGGDLRVFGEESQLVQIRHPLDPGSAAATLSLRERAIATSALYFVPALFDARTRRPMSDEVSVTVAAPDCMTADALTKIAFVLREATKALLDRHRADAFLLERNLPLRWLSRSDASQSGYT